MFGVLILHSLWDQEASTWCLPKEYAIRTHRSLAEIRQPVTQRIILLVPENLAAPYSTRPTKNGGYVIIIAEVKGKQWKTWNESNTSSLDFTTADRSIVGGGPRVICELVIRSTLSFGQPSWSCSMWRMPCDVATVVTFDKSNRDKLGQFSCWNRAMKMMKMFVLVALVYRAKVQLFDLTDRDVMSWGMAANRLCDKFKFVKFCPILGMANANDCGPTADLLGFNSS